MAESNINVVGNLTRDPELRFTPSGQAVVSANVAVNRRYQKEGEWQEEVSFIECTAWGTLAENIAESLVKGSRVLAVGRIEQQSWGEGDAKRSKIVIQCDSFGPELRWASCTVTKNDRRDGGSAPQQRSAPAGGTPAYEDNPGF